jgi:hypothetical protein
MTPLWITINLLVIAVTGLYVVVSWRRIGDLHVGFLLTAIFIRYSSASMADYTAVPGPGGLSINAITSLAIIAGGALLIAPRHLALRALWPLHVYLGVCIVSGALNRAPGPAISVLLNWTYMLILALLIRHSIRKFGCDRIMRLLLPVFAMPVVLGLLSYLVGFGQFSTHDGSISYHAGFNHESHYSVIVFTSLVVSLLVKWRQPATKFAFVVIAVTTIFLANYRTTVLGLLPLIALIGLSTFHAAVPTRFRTAASLCGLLAVTVSLPFIAANVPDRYAEIFVFLGSEGIDISDPTLMTETDRLFFSARLYIWSLYLHDFNRGDLIVSLFGWGPGTYVHNKNLIFDPSINLIVHAHNNFIFDLHQIGILGLGALLLLHANVIVRAALLADRHYASLLIAAQLGFMIIGLATTPFDSIEGLIAYAVLLGVTLGLSRPNRATAAAGWRFDAPLPDQPQQRS